MRRFWSATQQIEAMTQKACFLAGAYAYESGCAYDKDHNKRHGKPRRALQWRYNANQRAKQHHADKRLYPLQLKPGLGQFGAFVLTQAHG